MKPNDLHEKDQEPKPKPGEFPKAGEQSQRKPKLVVSWGMITHRPVETAQMPDSIAGEKPASLPADGNQAKAPPAAKPDAKNISSEAEPQVDGQPAQTLRSSEQGGPRRGSRNINPGRRLHAFELAAKKAPRTRVPWRYRLSPSREGTQRAYWNVATTISLVVNAILVAVVIILYGQIRNLQTSVNTTVNGVLGGLYSNFVKMDQASINTTIMVNAQIPLNFNLPVSQNTQVVLTSDVSIPKAHVVINTGGLNINAQANVTLPAGTALPIALNLNIPVQSTIPISLQVPVSIPMSQTELHGPFTGLQTSLRPLYCMFNKNAQYPEGLYICAEHDTPTPVTP